MGRCADSAPRSNQYGIVDTHRLSCWRARCLPRGATAGRCRECNVMRYGGSAHCAAMAGRSSEMDATRLAVPVRQTRTRDVSRNDPPVKRWIRDNRRGRPGCCSLEVGVNGLPIASGEEPQVDERRCATSFGDPGTFLGRGRWPQRLPTLELRVIRTDPSAAKRTGRAADPEPLRPFQNPSVLAQGF
jgi:hypothetical protein